MSQRSLVCGVDIWKALKDNPYGETRNHVWIKAIVESLEDSRAVG